MSSLPGVWSTDYDTVPLSAVATSRRTTTFIPQNGASSYAVANSTRIYIQISGADLIDPQAAFLEFSLAVTSVASFPGATTSGGILLPNSAESYIQRVVIKAGAELERIDYYNILETFQNQVYQNGDTVDGVGRATMGLTKPQGPLTERFIPFTTDVVYSTGGGLGYGNNRMYQIPLAGSGLFGTNKKLIPARWICANRALELEITLADFQSQVIVVPGTGGSGNTVYIPPTSVSAQIQNVRFVCDVLTSGTESTISRALAEGRIIPYPISTYRWYGAQIPTGVTSFNWAISHSASDITGVLVLFTAPIVDTGGVVGNKIANPSDSLLFPNLTFEGCYIKIGTAQFPLQPMRFQTVSTDTDVTTRMYSAAHAFNEMTRFAYYAPARVGAAMDAYNFGRNNYRSNALNPGGALTSVGAATNAAGSSTTNYLTGASPESCFALAYNTDASLSEEVAGTGVNTQSAGFQVIQITLLFDPQTGVPVWDPSTAKFGGPWSMHVFVRNRANVLISATGVALSTDLVDESTLGGPVL